MRDLNDSRGADDADTETLGDGQLEAGSVAELDIVNERLVAVVSEQRDTNVADWSREVLCDGLQHRAEGGFEMLHCLDVGKVVEYPYFPNVLIRQGRKQKASG